MLLRSPVRGLLLFVAIVGSFVLAACERPRTQLVAVLETDAASSVYDCVRVEVARLPAATTPASSLGLLVPAQVTLPFSTGIVPPDGDAGARVEVIAELRQDTCGEREVGEAPPRIRRVVRTGFLEGQVLRLPIFLADRCVDVLCGDGETCDGATGSCVVVPEIDPSTLASVGVGEELADAGVVSIDAGSTASDAGARVDAPLDLPAVCPTTGTMTGSRGSSVISHFGLAQSADGTRGVRSYVFSNGAGGEDLSGGSLGGGFFVVGPGGPTGVALSDDGVRGSHVFIHPARGFMVETYTRSGSTSDDSTIGGAGCATSRCVAEHLGHFVVLRGGSTLSLVEIAEDATSMGTAMVATGTTEGAVRAAATSLLLSWAEGTTCHLERREMISASVASTTVADCRSLDMAEMTDGRVAVAWVDTGGRVQVGVADAALTALAPLLAVDEAQSAPQPVEVNATSTGFRVTWVDDLAMPLLRSVPFDAAGSPLSSECVAVSGHTLAEYRRFKAVRRGASSAVEWVHGDSEFWGTTWTD